MTPASRRVLVVSYFYPPFASVGAVRVSKMTRYLADEGWQAEVLTIADDDRPGSMALGVPESSVHRVGQGFDVLALPRLLIGRPRLEGGGYASQRGWKSEALWRMSQVYRNLACFPDPQIGWLRPAIREGLRVIEQTRPEIILSSSLPNTSHLIARALARRAGLPWIAELRDLWTDNHNFRRVAPLRGVERLLERRVLRDATALVTVSEPWARALERLTDRPAYVVPNGFDPLDYPPDAAAAEVFTVAYTGMFYNGKQNPEPLLQAITAMAREGQIVPGTLRLRLAGYYLGPIIARAEELGIKDYVVVEPALSYDESLRMQREAHVLLFLDWADGHEKGWYSAKIYEYLGADRPVLSIGPRDSAVAGLMASTRAGAVASTSSEVRTFLSSAFGEFRARGSVAHHPDRGKVAGLTRQAAARRMAEILNTHA